MLLWLVLLLHILLLLVNLHVLLRVLLSLKHQELLLLGLIKNINSTCLVGWWRNASWEVCKLVKLVKVLSSLQQNLLVLSEMIIWVQVCISQNGDVLLEVTDLIVKIDEFLGLLLDEKWSISNIEFHYSFLLVVYILKIFHLVLSSLKRVVSLFLQQGSIA